MNALKGLAILAIIWALAPATSARQYGGTLTCSGAICPLTNGGDVLVTYSDTNQALNAKNWQLGIRSGVFRLRAADDALSSTSTFFTATRTAGAATDFQYSVPVGIQANGGTPQRTLHVGGNTRIESAANGIEILPGSVTTTIGVTGNTTTVDASGIASWKAAGMLATSFSTSGGIVMLKTGTPSAAGNGTLNTNSLDSAGKVTFNATGASTITLTFSSAFTRAPSCATNNETTSNLMRAISTTTTVQLSGVTSSGDVASYHCIGY